MARKFHKSNQNLYDLMQKTIIAMNFQTYLLYCFGILAVVYSIFVRQLCVGMHRLKAEKNQSGDWS